MDRRKQKELEMGFQSVCLRASGYSLRDPAQKCQMYYIVKGCNVNTALCHEAGWSTSYLRKETQQSRAGPWLSTECSGSAGVRGCTGKMWKSKTQINEHLQRQLTAAYAQMK